MVQDVDDHCNNPNYDNWVINNNYHDCDSDKSNHCDSYWLFRVHINRLIFDIHFVSGLYLEARSAQYFLLKVQSALDRSVTVGFFNTINHFNYLNYPYTFNRRSLKSPKEGTFFIDCCKRCRELVWIKEWVWCRGGGGGGGGISCYDKFLWNIYELNWNKMTKIQKIRWSYLLQTSK